MIDYIYDGTFDGLLTVIYHHYYTDRAAGIYTADSYQASFLHGFMEVETEEKKADKVYAAIRDKISQYDLRSVYRAWLSCDPEKEMKILRYVVLGFQQEHRTSSLHSHPAVADFQAILQKISHESERMLEFVRFSVVELPPQIPADPGSLSDSITDDPGTLPGVLPDANASADSITPASTEKNGTTPTRQGPVPSSVVPQESAPVEVLYAAVEPDNDVIELAARHFSDRFRNDRVIIHDVKRNKAVIAYRGRWIISAFAPEDAPAPSLKEMQYRRLWKQYFEHIAIMERCNSRCQNNFVPKRYRKHLTEFTTI